MSRHKQPIPHEAILASAGSGKTYQLAMRYIKLLASGCTPDQICAMTFSRKAAGEIFEAIVDNLVGAAGRQQKAEEVAKQIGMPRLGQADFLRLLRVLLDNLQKSHISTLDSFTVSVIRAFPLELGIGTDLELMDNDGSAARLTRYRVLSRIFNHRLVGIRVQQRFHEAFKEATFGREERDMVEPLDVFIRDYWQRFRALPHADRWGNADLIWPGGCRWLMAQDAPAGAAKRLTEIIESRSFPHSGIAGGLAGLAGKLAAYEVTAPWDDSLSQSTVLGRLLEIPDLAEADGARIRYYKEFTIGAEECGLWATLLNHLIGIEIRKALQETAGIGRILEQYHELYDPILRSGRMTFEDAQHLLTSSNKLSCGERVSRNAANRLYVDYRLNCALDHWLLDEFQDTSDLQWEVVSNLIDELMTDDTGEKSFFYVGDVKQAIHGWRGGNARLFGEVLATYGNLITPRPLHVSYRSCQPVVDMVNRVFGDLPDTVSAAARDRWSGFWEEHECAEGHVPANGYGALLQADATGAKGKCLPEDRYRAVGRLLNEIEPIRRGLSVAILVRGHDAAKKLADTLRRDCPGIPICHEGPAQLCDNPVVAVLLSLVRLAAHPGDTLAWQHLRMSPLGACIDEEKLDPGRLAFRLLGEVQEDGFEAMIRCWGARLGLGEDDDFGRKRIDDLAAAAAVFDAGESRNCSDFLHFISDHQTEEAGTAESVNIMTIHKAKGIGRDIVIVPDIERGLRGQVDFALPRDPVSKEGKWALKMPRKLVVDCDETLAEVRDRRLDEAEFEEICVLYVALTRAKCANYVIVGHDSDASSNAGILKSRLADDVEHPDWLFRDGAVKCLYEVGDRDWHKAHSLKKGAAARKPRELPAGFAKRESLRRHLYRREPSKHEGAKRSAAGLFGREDTDVRDFGLAIHQLFERVGWIEETDVEQVIREWQPTSDFGKQVTEDVVKQFRACMANETMVGALSRPAQDADLWVERRFDVVLGDEIVSGAFDRVILLRDAAGKPEKATIIDYKSSRVETEEEVDRRAQDYVEQMTAYRQALTKILGLAPSAVSCCLLFTRCQQTRTV